MFIKWGPPSPQDTDDSSLVGAAAARRRDPRWRCFWVCGPHPLLGFACRAASSHRPPPRISRRPHESTSYPSSSHRPSRHVVPCCSPQRACLNHRPRSMLRLGDLCARSWALASAPKNHGRPPPQDPCCSHLPHAGRRSFRPGASLLSTQGHLVRDGWLFSPQLQMAGSQSRNGFEMARVVSLEFEATNFVKQRAGVI
jgi:hypothetical protein